MFFKPVSFRIVPGCRMFLLAMICCRAVCNSFKQFSSALSPAVLTIEIVEELLLIVGATVVAVPFDTVRPLDGSALLVVVGKVRLPGILPCVVEIVDLFTMDPADTKPDPGFTAVPYVLE